MAAYFGFRPLSMVSLAAMSGVVMLYVGTAELTKGLFFRSRLAQSQNGIHEKPTQAGGWGYRSIDDRNTTCDLLRISGPDRLRG